MKAEHRHELEQNALNRGLSQLAEKAKSGEFLNTRTYLIIGAVVVLVGAGVYWWYAAKEYQRATSGMWRELSYISGPTGLEEVVKESKDPSATRIARLQLARVWLGPNGLQKMSSSNPETRKKAIESVEKARQEFEKLSGDFKNDRTLKAQCIDGQAHAELALVGIPKEGTFDQYLGSVPRAVELFREYAKLVGESTKAGESAKKLADDLSANEQDVLRISQALNNRLTPPPTPSIELPKSPIDLNPGVLPPPSKTPEAPTLPIPKVPETKSPPAPETKSPSAAVPPPSVPKAPEAKSPPAPTPPPPATKK